jgi:iron complex transport system substrate-binding protein
VTVTDDEGTTVALPTEPKRIVSLTAGTTEILFALGVADRVVAIDSASDYPAQALPLPKVADFGTLDAEKVVGLGADLVIAGGNGSTPPAAVAKLRGLGIPVVVVYPSTVDGVLGNLRLLGQSVGQTGLSVRLADSMKAEMNGLAEAVSGMSRPRTFYEVDATREIYGPADRSFLAEMVRLAGGDPVTSGSSDNFQISLERLIAADPQVIVLGDAAFGASPDVVRKRTGWSVMTAVRDGDVRPVDDKLVTRPGPRLAAGLRSLILAIHPDAHLP